jgi:6-pyruvoyltetrahydropterin/6-carboxytetrahydropterin synthase
MYALGVRREFIARHKLIGGDWGAENYPNSHHYVLELQLEAAELDVHGYLVDIVDVENHLTALIDYFKEQMLNDLPEFEGLNPSLENFARTVAVGLDGRLRAAPISTLRVVLWENASAWAAYTVVRSGQ